MADWTNNHRPDSAAAGASRSAPAAARHLDADTISAYLDGALPQDDQVLARRHLAACPACRTELTELRATVVLLRGLPAYHPPRSFRLGPEFAPPRPALVDRWLPWLPAVRLAATAAAALLLMTVLTDLVVNRDSGMSDVEQGSGTDTLLQASDDVTNEAASETGRSAPLEAEIADAREKAVGQRAALSRTWSSWRVAEVGLGLLLVGLLVVWTVLRRARTKRLWPRSLN